MSSRTTVSFMIAVLLLVSSCVGAWAIRVPKIGNFVWKDIDGDGIQDSGEPPMPGVRVELWTARSGWVAEVTTDGTGEYEFAWYDQSFKLRFTLPDGYQFTAQKQGADSAMDSDPNPETGETETFTVANGHPDNTRDAGVWAPSSIGDCVWRDTNRDGVEDTDENGIGGVTVSLAGDFDGDRNADLLLETTTDEDGYYSFGNLNAGVYKITVDTETLPEGLVAVGGTADTVEIALGFAENRDDVDFGYGPPIPAIDLEKSASPTTVHVGHEVTYTYIITNTGDETIEHITITDDAGTPSHGADDFSVGTLDALEKGQSKTFTKTVTMNASLLIRLRGRHGRRPFPGQVTNTAVATGTGKYSGEEVTDSDSATVQLTIPPVNPDG